MFTMEAASPSAARITPRDPRVGATCLGVGAADSVVENVLDERSLGSDRWLDRLPRWP